MTEMMFVGFVCLLAGGVTGFAGGLAMAKVAAIPVLPPAWNGPSLDAGGHRYAIVTDDGRIVWQGHDGDEAEALEAWDAMKRAPQSVALEFRDRLHSGHRGRLEPR